MGIKFKILFGFIILAAMLAIAGAWSIYEFSSIGDTVNDILDGEYTALSSAKNMKQSLERQDSGLLLSMLGKVDEGEKIMTSADSLFMAAFVNAESNSLIDGSNKELDNIKESYSQYRNVLKLSSFEQSENTKLDWYFDKPHKLFIKTMDLIDSFIIKNEQSMYNTSLNIVSKSHRAIMPGIVAIIAAIIFSIMFQNLVNFYFINPIIEITRRIRMFTTKRTPYDYQVETKDEVSELNDAVDILCSHVMAEEKH